MDWQQAIERNRKALGLVVAGLVPLVETAQGVPNPRPLRRFICRILRPAESALRRLIVVIAAALAGKARKQAGENRAARTLPDFSAFARRLSLPAFPLIDPRKRFGQANGFSGLARPKPRISLPGFSDPATPEKPEDSPGLSALYRRIERLDRALKTLPRQARRLLRLMARRAKAKPGPGRTGPLRPGHPPGHLRRPRHPVDDILRDCHFFALQSGLKPP